MLRRVVAFGCLRASRLLTHGCAFDVFRTGRRQLCTPASNTALPPVADISLSSRIFSLNGFIVPTDNHFMVYPDTMRIRRLVEKGHYVLVYGARGCGKTTYINYFLRYNFPAGWRPIYLSMEVMYEVSTRKEFWSTVWALIMNKLPGTSALPAGIRVTTSRRFTEAVLTINVPFVLLLDEFDAVLENPVLRDDVLHTFRGLRDFSKTPSETTSGKSHNLKAIVGIGPLSIVNDVHHVKRFSPFNVTESFPVPYFTREETHELFKQLSDATGIPVDAGIVDSIFELTNGHKGFVGVCGKIVQGKLFTLAKWQRFAQEDLPTRVSTMWPTAQRIKQFIRSDPEYFAYLSISLLYHGNGFKESVREDNPYRSLALHLASNGILETDLDRDLFWIPSPLVRAMIEEAGFPKPAHPRFIGEDIDIEEVIVAGIQNIDGRPIKRAFSKDFGNVYFGAATEQLERQDPSANEEVYSFGFRLSLRELLSNIWILQPFVKVADANKICDVVVHTSVYGRQSAMYVAHAIEFCANVPENSSSKAPKPGSLQDHFKRTAEVYSTIPNVQSSWVINFTTSKTSPTWLDKEIRPHNVNVVNVFHLSDWSFVQCRVNDESWFTLIEDGKRTDLAKRKKGAQPADVNNK